MFLQGAGAGCALPIQPALHRKAARRPAVHWVTLVQRLVGISGQCRHVFLSVWNSSADMGTSRLSTSCDSHWAAWRARSATISRGICW